MYIDIVYVYVCVFFAFLLSFCVCTSSFIYICLYNGSIKFVYLFPNHRDLDHPETSTSSCQDFLLAEEVAQTGRQVEVVHGPLDDLRALRCRGLSGAAFKGSITLLDPEPRSCVS